MIRRIRLLPRASSASLVGLVAFLACAPPGNEAPDSTVEDQRLATDGMEVRGRVDFDPPAGTFEADLTTRFHPGPGDQQEFLLNRSLDLREVSGPEVLGFTTEPLEPGADWNRIRVRLDPERQAGPLTVRFLYGGEPKMPGDGINRISSDWIELSFDSAWHPVTAAVDREITAELELGLPRDWTVVSSGEARTLSSGFRLEMKISQPDIAFVAAPRLEMERGDGFVVFHLGADGATTTAILEAAEACRTVLDRRFGAARRLPAGRLVLADRLESGYARKNYIVLSDVSDRRGVPLTEFLCHELAHFWSSGAKPLTVDNWLNEGFATLVAAQAVGELHGEGALRSLVDDWTRQAEGQPSIWTASDPRRRPWAVSYKKAPLSLLRLEETIGPERFERIVVRALTDPVNDTPALLEVIDEEAGGEARAWFVEVLSEGVASPES